MHDIRTPKTADPISDRRAGILRNLTEHFGFRIIRIVKSMDDHPAYRMYTDLGVISLGKIGVIMSQTSFRNRVAETIQISIPTLACLKKYLQEKPPIEDIQEAASVKRPFIKNNQISIFLADFEQWLNDSSEEIQDDKGTPQKRPPISKGLRSCGAESYQENVIIQGRRTTRSCWLLPDLTYPRT